MTIKNRNNQCFKSFNESLIFKDSLKIKKLTN